MTKLVLQETQHHTVRHNYVQILTENHIITLLDTHTRYLALGPRFGLVLGPQGRLLSLQEVATWKIFEFLGGLVSCRSYQVQQTTCLKSFHFLCTYPHKVFSAWAEVWSIPWPSRAPIIAPGGRDLDDF